VAVGVDESAWASHAAKRAGPEPATDFGRCWGKLGKVGRQISRQGAPTLRPRSGFDPPAGRLARHPGDLPARRGPEGLAVSARHETVASDIHAMLSQ
jgi:hypothetical protein